MEAFWLNERGALDRAILASEGIASEQCEVGAHEPMIARWMKEGGYRERDEIVLEPSTEHLETICAKFADEHHHDEDEVRFVLDGGGIFDIRSSNDRWMRVVVGRGDLIVVPKGRHHRFLLTSAKSIRCLRLFQNREGWVPHYRNQHGGG